MPCADFLTSGFCKFGDRCLFNHEPASSLQSPGSISIASSDSSIPQQHYFSPNSYDHHHHHQLIYENSSTPGSSSHTSPSAPSIALSTESELASLSDAQATSPVRDGSTKRVWRPRVRKNQKNRSNRQPQLGAMGMADPASLIPPSHFQSYSTSLPFSPLSAQHDYFQHTLQPHRKSSYGNFSAPSLSPAYPNYPFLPFQPNAPFFVHHQPQSAFPSPSLASSQDEIYDFDTDSETDSAVLEKPKLVSTYEGSKVGVLGGGVKLGKSFHQRTASLHDGPDPLSVTTVGRGLFEDSDSSDDDEEDDDDVEVILLMGESSSPPCLRSLH